MGDTPAPGVYADMSFADYLAADAVSISALGTLLDSFPARLKHQKPSTKPMEDGRIAHALVLEGVNHLEDSKRYIVTPKGFSMSHVKKHEDLIERIIETGAMPISEDRVEAIHAMHDVLRADKAVMAALSNGTPEVSVFWIDDGTGLLCKARFDWVPNRGAVFPDYKTAHSLDPEPLSRAIATYRIAHRSAWYEDAARIALGRGTEERPPLYLPIWQEKAEPYFVAMQPVERSDVELSRVEIDRAMSIYAECKARDHWPGPQHYEPIGLPHWARRRLEFVRGDAENVRME